MEDEQILNVFIRSYQKNPYYLNIKSNNKLPWDGVRAGLFGLKSKSQLIKHFKSITINERLFFVYLFYVFALIVSYSKYAYLIQVRDFWM